MLKRNFGLKIDDLKELRAKPVQTWCTIHMTKGKASRTRIIASQSKILPSRRRRRIRRWIRVALCVVPLIIEQRSDQTAKEKKPQPEEKTANMVTNVGDGTSGYGNLPLVLLVFQSTTWWLDSDANVHVCSNAFLFSSYQVVRDSFMMIGNESHAYIYGVDTVDLKLTSRKIIQLKNMYHVLSINKNQVGNSLYIWMVFRQCLSQINF
jgi:hypothetical protein